MTLLPGCRIAVASKFHLEADWPARLRLGTGVEAVACRYFPVGPWRALTDTELALVVEGPAPSRSLPLLGADAAPPTTVATGAPDAIQLFQLPGHLREQWWKLVDETAESANPMRGFDEFAGQVAELLAFKRLDIPAGARMEAVVTAPGERSIRRDPESGAASGLGPTLAPWTPWPLASQHDAARLWGIVNLDDEPTGVVLINLSLAGLGAELTPRSPAAPPATVGEVVQYYLQASLGYPPLRIQLGPGEGCRLPPGGLILDGDPSGKEEPDLLLLIAADGPARPEPE